MATKLNQILAIEKGVRARTARELTDAHRETQQVDRLSGVIRTYQPRDDDGQELPSESTNVQVVIDRSNQKVADALTRLFDVVATKDYANTHAQADVVVDGEALLTAVPPTFLLFLEKRLVDLHTYIDKLAVLDPAVAWEPAPTSGEGVSRTAPVMTAKTNKVPKPVVLYDATKEHPAQVQVFNEDVIVGDWTTIKFSGAITKERKQLLLERVDKLAQAVKYAREQANQLEVTDQNVGAPIFDYLFA